MKAGTDSRWFAGVILAVGVTGAALVLALALQPLAHAAGEPLFLLAIAASALLGGLGPGVLALVLSIAAINWWFLAPEHAFGYENTSDLLQQLVFAIAGLLIAVLGGRARALQWWAEARAAEAELPLEGAEGRLADTARHQAARERKPEETVLIVDPDAEARRLASHAVEAAGYRWVSACDGVEALELLDRYDVPFALVVTDVGLPDIPGPELMRRIAERRPGLPVLYTSTAPAAAFGTAPTGQPLLEKPFTPDELIRRTRDVLGEAAAQREVAG